GGGRGGGTGGVAVAGRGGGSWCGKRGVGQPLSAPGSGGACLGASFVSVGRFAASHSTIPPLSALARYPCLMRSAATFELAISLGSESYTTISRSLGKEGSGLSPLNRRAPGSF